MTRDRVQLKVGMMAAISKLNFSIHPCSFFSSSSSFKKSNNPFGIFLKGGMLAGIGSLPYENLKLYDWFWPDPKLFYYHLLTISAIRFSYMLVSVLIL